MRLENTTEHPITLNGHKDGKPDGKSVTVPAATGVAKKTNGVKEKVDGAWVGKLRETDPAVAGYFDEGDLLLKEDSAPGAAEKAALSPDEEPAARPAASKDNSRK